MATSKARIRANNKFNAKAYDQINIRVPKKTGVKPAAQDAADKQGVSFADYVTTAISNRLQTDGINPLSYVPAEGDSQSE